MSKKRRALDCSRNARLTTTTKQGNIVMARYKDIVDYSDVKNVNVWVLQSMESKEIVGRIIGRYGDGGTTTALVQLYLPMPKGVDYKEGLDPKDRRLTQSTRGWGIAGAISKSLLENYNFKVSREKLNCESSIANWFETLGIKMMQIL